MPKRPTFPSMTDRTVRVDLTIFKEWGLLKPDLKSSGTYQDVRNGELFGSIDFFLHTGTAPYCVFSGKFKGIPFEKTIKMVAIESNLNHKIALTDSKVYYFLCPITGKRCRKLYVIGGRFGSAKGFDLYYPQQVLSKNQISWESYFGALRELEKVDAELFSSGMRTSYNGKITKRYAGLLRKQMKLDNLILKMSKLNQAQIDQEIKTIQTDRGFATIEIKRKL